MRCFKLLLMGGIVLALTVPTRATTIPFQQAYNGPVYLDIEDYDDSVIYDWNNGLLADGQTPIVTGTAYPAGLVKKSWPGYATVGNESAWGIFKVGFIEAAEITGPNGITQVSPRVKLFEDGDNSLELVGIFYGGQDQTVTFLTPGALGMQEIAAGGYTVDFYTQTVGTYDGGGPVGGPGATNRFSLERYPTVGYDAAGNLLGSAELVLRLKSQAGIQQDEFEATFTPDGGGSGNGQFNFYASVYGDSTLYADPLDPLAGGSMNDLFETDIFPCGGAVAVVPDTWADIRFKGTSDPTNKEWIVHSSDPATGGVIPEPVTMAGLLLGIGCLGRYIRRRR